MGKSPAKWIKTVLFGKKSSKSHLSKGAQTEKKAASEPAAGDLGLSHSVISDTPYQSTDRGGEKAESEEGVPGGVPCIATLMPANEGLDLQNTIDLGSADDEEIGRLEQAATKAQAAFRGYLARRAFRALKGIIRLQALIRGHLVRRQAIATLRCMQSIVRLQALARGQRVRLSYPGFELSTKCRLPGIQDATRAGLLVGNMPSRSEKLSTNVFACKLLASLPAAMPLSLQYDLAEPNSSWIWLERWSLLHFWEPLGQPKTVLDVKSQGKQASTQIAEGETGKSRRTFRKAGNAATGDSTVLSSLEVDKPRRNPRKLASHQMESLQEQPNELERVKRSLRKVSASTTIVSEKPETDIEKPPQNMRKASNVTALNTSQQAVVNLSENPSESTVVVDKLAEPEASSKALTVDDPVDLPPDDHPIMEQNSLENGTQVEVNSTVDEDLSLTEDLNGKENQRTRRRRSFPVKQEYPENASQNTPSLPSYMAATESAKAKLRAQGAAKLSEEAENGFVRRHSLPTSTNGKLSSLSPRMQKPAQANGKGGIKSNKSLSSSRDERVLHPGWRR